ncbi:MAG: TolC family protein [Lachnospiraceae bacterium]|nr:TolC family protein [Lachnospiraceae bacterium]
MRGKRFPFLRTRQDNKRRTSQIAIGFLTVWIVGMMIFPSLAEDKKRIEYDNLRQLLLEGNLELKQANDSYESNKKNYQDLMEQMQDEQAYMKFLAEKYEDTEEEATYRSNAAILGAQVTRLSKQLEAMNRQTKKLSVEENTDSYTMAAQSVMNSYNQMALNVTASEKRVQAAEASYEAMKKKHSAGAATAAQVSEAADRLISQRNLLSAYQQQSSQLRFQLLSMLGLPDDGTVTIGTLPEPDLIAVDAVDYESDKQKAVNNNSSVQNVRHSRAGTTSEIHRKAAQEVEAVGNAEAEFLAIYQELQTAKVQYLAAVDAHDSACMSYESLQLKKQAGMLSQTEYLEGEAEYLQNLADYGEASMNLIAAMESYRWAVKGTEGPR